MKKKPGYIWLSIPAFMILVANSNYRISKYTRKNKISKFDDRSAWTRFVTHMWGQMFVRLLLPTIFVMILFHLNETRWGILGTTNAEMVQFICVYLLGVYIAYKHVQWREKNISHMLEPEQEEDSDSSDSN